jgi:hypothetical protein
MVAGSYVAGGVGQRSSARVSPRPSDAGYNLDRRPLVAGGDDLRR